MIKSIDQALESPPTSAGGRHHQKRLNLGTIVNSQQEDEVQGLSWGAGSGPLPS